MHMQRNNMKFDLTVWDNKVLGRCQGKVCKEYQEKQVKAFQAKVH